MKTLFAVDELNGAIAHDLSSRYCPVDRTIFLGRLGFLFAALCGIAVLFFLLARLGARNPRSRELAYIGAAGVAIFAIGSGALIIFGLSGCGGEAQAGLTWDWPW